MDTQITGLAQRESALVLGALRPFGVFFNQFNPSSTFIQFHKNPRISPLKAGLNLNFNEILRGVKKG